MHQLAQDSQTCKLTLSSAMKKRMTKNTTEHRGHLEYSLDTACATHPVQLTCTGSLLNFTVQRAVQQSDEARVPTNPSSSIHHPRSRDLVQIDQSSDHVTVLRSHCRQPLSQFHYGYSASKSMDGFAKIRSSHCVVCCLHA